jgi:CHAD domain-containing protein
VSYRLELDDGVGEAIARVARERLDHAVAQLRETVADDRVSAIHDVRTDLKKLRALLRLVQPDLDRRVRRRENRRLAEVARALSGARDADVLVEVADELARRYPGHAPATTFEALRRRLSDAAQDARGDADDTVVATAADELQDVRDRLDQWPLEGLDDATLLIGLERTYARGRAAFAVAEATPGAHELHEWRKRVKDLWYQQRLLRDTWPKVMKAQIDELAELAELLGDDHDLAVLRELLDADRGAAAQTPADLEPVIAVIDRRRGDLLGAARALGRRVYAERPRRFARRHRAYLRAARDEQTAGAQTATAAPA